MTIAKEFIIDLARDYYGIALEPDRAGEIASEVDALNHAVLSASAALEFDDSPAEFATALAGSRKQHGRAGAP